MMTTLRPHMVFPNYQLEDYRHLLTRWLEVTLKCLDGIEIERVETMKYLGIIIDDKLRFKAHCDYMLKKIGKKTSFLNRIGNFISAYTRCIIYKTIIAPHFEYCVVRRY